MISLSTHVLDTMHGVPAAQVALVLAEAEGTVRFSGATDRDGRCPDLPGLNAGCYRLGFGVADYFRRAGVALSDPPFLDVVWIDFGVVGADGHYHVPLLVSPFAYSTYRGS